MTKKMQLLIKVHKLNAVIFLLKATFKLFLWK
jgi:hypothetical protein